MGQTVNLLVYTFGGSNPSSPTLHLAEVAQLIEHQPSKLRVAGLSPVFRSIQSQHDKRITDIRPIADCRSSSVSKSSRLCSSGVAHFLGKEEVAGSNPAIGSTFGKFDSPDSARRYRGV